MMKYTLTFSCALLAGVITAATPAIAAATPMHVWVGASPAPPKGAGPGKLTVVPLRPGDAPYVVKFGRAGTPSGNSFYIAESDKMAYVPSVAGYTDVINIRTGKRVQRFDTIRGCCRVKKTQFVVCAIRQAPGRLFVKRRCQAFPARLWWQRHGFQQRRQPTVRGRQHG